MKIFSKPVTSPRLDALLGIVGGLGCLLIGGSMIASGDRWQVGAAILVASFASFVSAWRLSRRPRDPSREAGAE